MGVGRLEGHSSVKVIHEVMNCPCVHRLLLNACVFTTISFSVLMDQNRLNIA